MSIRVRTKDIGVKIKEMRVWIENMRITKKRYVSEQKCWESKLRIKRKMRVCTKDMRINIENHDNGDMSPNKRQETLAKDMSK